MWDFVHDVNNRNIIFFSYIQNLIFFEMYQYILITFAIIGILIIAFIIYNTNSKDNTDAQGPIKKNNSIYKWFQHDAEKKNKPLHIRSGWGYLNKLHFNEMTDSWLHKMNPPIKQNESVFEMGCGVGAILTHISNTFASNGSQQDPTGSTSIKVGGSDFSPNAIQVAKNIFKSNNFYCLNMIDKHPIPDNSVDHVISSGALGMYLKKEEMVLAIKEAVRMTKPGGSLCFTHFLEEKGHKRGSIVDKVNKSYWISLKDELGIDNIVFGKLKHQGDRYFFTCIKI
jgi:SAM-dependent methyltransferase